MIIDRKQIPWFLGTVIASLVVAGLYYSHSEPKTMVKVGGSADHPAMFGSTGLGLIYGTVALAIFIFAACLGLRRKLARWPFGNIKVWLRAHVWLTILTIPLVVYHSGFHGGGPMTQALLWLYGFVMVSGFWGLFMQNIIPRMMRDRLEEEVTFDQIPTVRANLHEEAGIIYKNLVDLEKAPKRAGAAGLTSLVAPDREHASGELESPVATATEDEPASLEAWKASLRAATEFAGTKALPYLEKAGARGSVLREKEASDGQFRLIYLQMPEPLQPQVERLQEICDEKRRLDWQLRYHAWLHWWLLLHAPTSLLLIVLTTVHAVVAEFIYS